MTKNFPKVFLIFVLPLLVALGLASCANSEQTGSVSFAVTPELARFVSAANASLEFDALLEDGTQLDNQEKTYTITVSLSGGYTDSQTNLLRKQNGKRLRVERVKNRLSLMRFPQA